jgi:hypothetical protein
VGVDNSLVSVGPDRLCGLVVRVPGYRSGGPDFLRNSPLSLVSTTEELLGRKSSGSGLESQEYGHRDSSRRLRGTLYPQKLAPTSPISGGRSVGIVLSQTQATEFVFRRSRSQRVSQVSTERCP